MLFLTCDCFVIVATLTYYCPQVTRRRGWQGGAQYRDRYTVTRWGVRIWL